MPKPFTNLTGNSAHVHITMHVEDGSNAFKARGSNGGVLGLSEIGLHFCGGLLETAQDICCFTNPTINSFKRINAPPPSSGSSWSPSSISWTGNNRTHMIRVPDAPRLEVRLPDSSSNPYLMPAALLLAGLCSLCFFVARC
mmetsp:Transcript_93/g.213  ORF Transcript_93/g.213 Transcript_93/m.213 type:complete len:141 (+) Transcript_93:2-424(+)